MATDKKLCECGCGEPVIRETARFRPGHNARCQFPMPKRRPEERVSFTLNGITKPAGEWAKEAGISFTALRKRLAMGWPLEKALTSPRSPSPKRPVCPTCGSYLKSPRGSPKD